MKKIFALILCLALLGLCGCKSGKEPSAESQVATVIDSQTESEPKGPQEKVQYELKGTLEQSTEFSNGYAIVKIKEEDAQNYWINKKGEVLAVLPNVVFSSGQTYPAKTSEIGGGFVLVSDYSTRGYTKLCDVEGNVYSAEDFGVTAFHPDALADGYIITTTESDNASIKIGVLDCELFWVMKPNDSLAQEIGFGGTKMAQKLGKYYEEYKVFCERGGFDVRNGSVFSKNAEDMKSQIAQNIENWELKNGVYGYTYGGKFIPKVNLAKLVGLKFSYITLEVEETKFTNKRAPVLIGTHQEQTQFTLIDTSGNMVFEPVDFGLQIDRILIDGGCVLVVGQNENTVVLKTYDMSGTQRGKYQSHMLGGSVDFKFGDGVIKFEQSELLAEGVMRTTWLYNPEFKKLF